MEEPCGEMDTAKLMPRTSGEGLRRCGYHERPLGREYQAGLGEQERTETVISSGFSEPAALRCTPDTGGGWGWASLVWTDG